MTTKESKIREAIQLLKQRPFEFVDHGRHRGALPDNFHPKLGDADWGMAIAVMAVIRSKPSTWQWTATRIMAAGRLRDSDVRDGVQKLKAEGWVGHANIYDGGKGPLATILLAFSKPIPEYQRAPRKRFVLRHTPEGWMFGYSTEGRSLRSGVSENEGGDARTTVVRTYNTVVRTLTLKRAQSDSSVPSAAEPEITQCDSPPPAPQEPEAEARPTTRKATPSPPAAPEEPSENVINDRKRLARELERLGEKRDDSEADALAYEEFVSTRIIAELELPERSDKSRRRHENLEWVESNLLGMILLQMSSSSCWTTKTARRLIRRAGHGFINFADVRTLLFAFDWTLDRRSRKTLEDMTDYGEKFDHNKGAKVEVNAWARMISNARETYRRGILGPVLEQRNRLFPQNEDDLGVNHHLHDTVMCEMKAICTGAVKPDEEGTFLYSLRDPDALAFLLSRHRRSEKTQRKVDESKDLLEEYFATDYAGILLYRSNYHLIPETMGLTLDGIKKRHRKQVDMIQQRLSYHGYATDDIQPYI